MFRIFFYIIILILTTYFPILLINGKLLSNYYEYIENDWKTCVELVENSKLRLCWRINNNADLVTFLLECNTKGYVGIGFSSDNRMAGSDILVAWVNDETGKGHIVDCHGGNENGMPKRDDKQDVELLAAYQNETHTTVLFSRLWNTCDYEQDVILSNGTTRLIWAFDEVDPIDDTLYNIQWHGTQNRGATSIHLKDTYIKAPTKRHYNNWDVRFSNFTAPDNLDTIYWCKIFKAPKLSRKHHIIGYSPLMDTRNKGMLHHMVLYECHGRASFRMEQYVTHPGQTCYSNDMPINWETCITPIAAWAVGSQGEFFPEHVGLPMGEEHGDKYYMLEAHFDNPTLKRVVDSSGLRLYYTDILRKHDGGIFSTGTVVSPLHIIPPMQPAYKTAGYCDKYCTNLVFPQGGVNSISVVLHSHTAARKIRLRHFRQGEELSPIAQDDHYDFNYQQSMTLEREVTIFPADELVTQCVYNTVNRTQPTQGGFSTKDEMCLAYVMYYPKVSLSSCLSMTPVTYFFHTFGIKQFYHYDMETIEKMFLKLTDKQLKKIEHTTKTLKFPNYPPGGESDPKINEAAVNALKQMAEYTLDESYNDENLFQQLVIQEPMEFQNKTFFQHLQELPWKETLLTQRVEEMFYYGNHMTFCRLGNDSLAMPATVHMFPNVTLQQVAVVDNSKCMASLKHESSSSNASNQNASTFIITLLFIFALFKMF